jgi:16S rRNA (guanine527-N7)-methyltransferase
VKRPRAVPPAADLAAEAARFGVALDPATRDRLEAFCARLLRWGRTINLTGARSREDLAAEHLPDAFALCGLIPPGARLADVGSGGGLPAIPFALLRPDCEVTLLEPRSRRAAFLRAAVDELAVRAVVVERRLEDFTGFEPFDAASSRATFPPAAWLAAARRLVRPGGRVLVFTTPGEADALALAAGPPTSQRPYTLGRGQARRLLAYDVPRGTPPPPTPVS